MVARLIIEEKTNTGFTSKRGIFEAQMWFPWHFAIAPQSVSMFQSKSNISKAPSRDIHLVPCFLQDKAFEQSPDACFHRLRKEVVPLAIRITKPFNPNIKSITKYSTI